MTKVQTLGGIAVLSLLALLSPFLIGAAERALTIRSLEAGYQERLAHYDAEIASTTKALDAMVIPKNVANHREPYRDAMQKQWALSANLVELQRDREITEAAYELLVASLK